LLEQPQPLLKVMLVAESVKLDQHTLSGTDPVDGTLRVHAGIQGGHSASRQPNQDTGHLTDTLPPAGRHQRRKATVGHPAPHRTSADTSQITGRGVAQTLGQRLHQNFVLMLTTPICLALIALPPRLHS
jgi:hypothetical protein